MIKVLLASLFTSALLASSTCAQASITHYGSTGCSTWQLQRQGTPRLGTSFELYFRPVPCTHIAEVIIIGFSQTNVPVTLPASYLPQTCSLLVAPELVVSGRSALFAVPSNPVLIGTQFHAQGVYYGRSCMLLPWLDLFSVSRGATCTIGP